MSPNLIIAVCALIGALPSAASGSPAIDNFWLTINVFFDIGIGFFVIALAMIMPRWQTYSFNRLQKLKDAAALRKKKGIRQPINFWVQMGKMYSANLWLVYSFVTICVWFGTFTVMLSLILSKGFINPLSLYGLYYDFLFARANDQPNGAHVWSYIMVVLVMLVYAYKFLPSKSLGVLRVTGNIYEGIVAGLYAVAVHEGLWIIFYYGVYYKYLTWADANNVLRDVSFAVMLVLIAIAYWRYPKRSIPMKVFLVPTLLYLGFLFAWLAFGFPITTINNPTYANNFYQETVWFANPWVNLTEIASWILLGGGFIVAILRFKAKE